MKSRLLFEEAGEKTWAVIFDVGDEVADGLTRFARENGIEAAHFTAIGAFSDAVLGFYDLVQEDYLQIPVPEQVEVLSLLGDIAMDNEQPKVHAHAVVGRSDGSTRGGHLLSAHVQPTLEVIIESTPAHLRRRFDRRSGLALISL